MVQPTHAIYSIAITISSTRDGGEKRGPLPRFVLPSSQRGGFRGLGREGGSARRPRPRRSESVRKGGSRGDGAPGGRPSSAEWASTPRRSAVVVLACYQQVWWASVAGEGTAVASSLVPAAFSPAFSLSPRAAQPSWATLPTPIIPKPTSTLPLFLPTAKPPPLLATRLMRTPGGGYPSSAYAHAGYPTPFIRPAPTQHLELVARRAAQWAARRMGTTPLTQWRRDG